MAFRSKPGFSSSSLRMCMFGITAFMFALGVIAMVLDTTMGFLTAEPHFDSHGDPFYARCYYVWATITCLMVRLRDAFMPSDLLH